MRRLSIGIQSFEYLRKNDYVYVDKTKYIYELVSRNKVYFLSRPRRFGKSLFLSTLEAYFKGKKELFKGLAIEKFEENNANPWMEYPVLTLSFAAGNYSNPGELEKKLGTFLRNYEEMYELPSHENDIFGDRFVELISGVSKKVGENAVVLIDEYDKPLLDNISVNKELEEKNRRTLKGFFCALKDADDYLQFAFVTGVTKFSKVSLFSDVNQMKDISLNPIYADMCGITEAEMVENYEPELSAMAENLNCSFDECINKLEENYDGYHFSEKSEGVYNPFSLLNALTDMNIRNYWYSTGTPSFLIKALHKNGLNIQNFENGISATEEMMMDYRADESDAIPLFYQSGYLTIKGYDSRFKEYTLGFPNEEVKYGFLNSLVPRVDATYAGSVGDFSVSRIVSSLQKGDIESCMQMLKALLASIPYYEGKAPQNEQQWRNLIYAVFTILGQYVRVEVHSAGGRSDCVLENEGFVYIFEFKQDKTAREALQQINEKGYATPYISTGKKIVKIGANFSSKEKTINEWAYR